MFSEEDGELAVRTARAVAEAETEGRVVESKLPPSFDAERGVFVTINEHPSGVLRGCIGYPMPIMPLSQALVLSARNVCHDPRFPDLRLSQAKKCVFEVTVLTEPEEIQYKDPADLMAKIQIGKDGLLLRYRRSSGVFLPQVPVEQGWNVEEYLNGLCVKAGLQSDAWRSGALGFWKFQGEIFSETSPGGDIVKK